MTKREKLRQKLRNNPQSATMEEVETLLHRFGFVLDRVSGSHHVFVYRQGILYRSITVPLHGRKVKAVYVQQISNLLDELFPKEKEDEEENSDDSENS
jgi:predicted RNA binding protein YcfA (HicA-like mRNA interferase family)